MNYCVMKGKEKMKMTKTMNKRKMKKENLRENVFASVGFFFCRLVCIKHLRGGQLHQVFNQVFKNRTKKKGIGNDKTERK